ncbi:D-arabinono-1,4-lactone oxidase [Spirilliplanes yamanashiensis]|uniref:FAD-linked oxidoreductase n=1 Tax=Spirilliplanes yamanashiensis TaxID=42233 RepID=A0A8J3Y8A4_9ACTN|nr:D-arabinono-1,4-lactone oxidase [Spirilliplanes yamanashiensis]MDP9815469.1 L-gulonolactone oxidase [Spirilliplanes yamanashiensis]GIJ03723.1 FAD-linked oxidoreductase [Spirilliplanes yamanashiensis]
MAGNTEAPQPAPALAWHNWGRNQRAIAAAVYTPATVEDVASLVKQAAESGRRVKAVGSGHSFTAIARTDDQRLQLDRMAGLVSIDAAAKLVTVQAGMTVRTLNAILARHGLAVANLGDIDAQTVAGATSTGTHGTGRAHATLASLVEAVTLVTGTGEVRRIVAGDPLFGAARLGLGALGVVTEITLRCVDAFTLRADERPMAMADMLAGLDEHIAANDHAEFYWYPYTDRVQLKRNNVVAAHDRPLPKWREWVDDELLANTVYAGANRFARAFPAAVPTIMGVAARALTARTYTAPSYEVFVTPRRVRFTEMEYCVPRAALGEAFGALPGIIAKLPFKVQFPVEVRFTGPDDVWLSHGHGRDNAYIAVHQFSGMPHEPYFQAFEKVCLGLEGRPHWGKLHYRDAASLRPVYPRFDDFLAARDQLDPQRVFTNPHLDRVLGP